LTELPKYSFSCFNRVGFKSNKVTLAPRPTAILAAFVPTTPPPIIVTLPRFTPEIPASKTPLPPFDFSRYCAPICVAMRSEEHTSELQSRFDLVCRLLLEKKKHENSDTTKAHTSDIKST